MKKRTVSNLSDESQFSASTTKLSFSQTSLATFSPTLTWKLTSLTSLNLSKNNFTHFPLSLLLLCHLKTLTLSGNKIEVLPQEIAVLSSSLRELNLSHNSLVQIPASLSCLTRLSVLDLQNNCLRDLPTQLATISSLRSCVIFDNNSMLSPPPSVAIRGSKSLLSFLEHIHSSMVALSDPHYNFHPFSVTSYSLFSLPQVKLLPSCRKRTSSGYPFREMPTGTAFYRIQYYVSATQGARSYMEDSWCMYPSCIFSPSPSVSLVSIAPEILPENPFIFISELKNAIDTELLYEQHCDRVDFLIISLQKLPRGSLVREHKPSFSMDALNSQHDLIETEEEPPAPINIPLVEEDDLEGQEHDTPSVKSTSVLPSVISEVDEPEGHVGSTLHPPQIKKKIPLSLKVKQAMGFSSAPSEPKKEHDRGSSRSSSSSPIKVSNSLGEITSYKTDSSSEPHLTNNSNLSRSEPLPGNWVERLMLQGDNNRNENGNGLVRNLDQKQELRLIKSLRYIRQLEKKQKQDQPNSQEETKANQKDKKEAEKDKSRMEYDSNPLSNVSLVVDEENHPKIENLLFRFSYFAIFDGHSGEEASQYCVKHLLKNVMHFCELDYHEAINKRDQEDNNNNKTELRYEFLSKEAIMKAYSKTDHELISYLKQRRMESANTSNQNMDTGQPNQDKQKDAKQKKDNEKDEKEKEKKRDKTNSNQGTTATTIFFKDNKMIVAHVGDTRAVLCRNHGPIRLTVDHKPDLPEEKQRIIEAGGTVEMVQKTARVNGQLAVSRSLGDRSLKKVITHQPDVSSHIITPQDQFVVLASDGLWDVFSDTEVVNLVLKMVGSSVTKSSEVARELVRRAYVKGSSDNISCMVLFFRWFATPISYRPLSSSVNTTPTSTTTSSDQQAPSTTNPVFEDGEYFYIPRPTG